MNRSAQVAWQPDKRLNAFYDSLPIFLQNVACSVGGLQRARTRYSRHFHRTLEEWERLAEASPEAQLERQWTELQATLDRARRFVPYYADLPDPVSADDPATALEKTLARIPPLEKGVYRVRARDFVSSDVSPRQLVEVSTSGTTGTALPIWHSPERIAEGYAAVWRQRHRFMVRFDDPNMTFGGSMIVPLRQTTPPFWRTNRYGGQTLFSIFHLAPENLESYVEQIHQTPAAYIQGYPSALYLVSRAMLDAGRPLEPGGLRGVFTSSESLLSFQREAIEAAFGAPVRDHYSATELCVSMAACRLNHLHVDTEYCIVEVEPLEETDDYVRGPLLVTGIGSWSTPFIRYRIGDVGTRLKGPCPCGRPGEVFLDIDGRIEDYVMTPDRRLVGRLDHIFKQQFDVVEAQIVQESRRAVEVLVVPADRFGDETRQGLERAIRRRLGDEMDVSIRVVDRIEREPNGKFRAVKSSVARMAP